MIKVSVVVPCYNAEALVEASFQTLLAQTLQEMEFIYVDDGSTDGTPQLLDSFAERDPRVRVVHQPNMRLGAARNTGIRHAQGEYVGFLDSDDVLSPNFYKALYEAAKRHEADIAWTGLMKRIYGRDVRWIQNFAEEREVNDLQERFDMLGFNYYVVSKVSRREFLLDNQLCLPERVLYEDAQFTAKANLAAKMLVTVPGEAYYYIYNPKSIVNRRQTREAQIDRYNMIKGVVEMLKANNLRVPKRWQRLRKWSYYIGPICLYKVRDCGWADVYSLFDILPFWFKRN